MLVTSREGTRGLSTYLRTHETQALKEALEKSMRPAARAPRVSAYLSTHGTQKTLKEAEASPTAARAHRASVLAMYGRVKHRLFEIAEAVCSRRAAPCLLLHDRRSRHCPHHVIIHFVPSLAQTKKQKQKCHVPKLEVSSCSQIEM